MGTTDPNSSQRTGLEVPGLSSPTARSDVRVTTLAHTVADAKARQGLLRRRRTGPSVDALEAVYREHVSAVYGFFSYSVGRDAAEDLTAATFERVVRSWTQFDPSRASERTWIFAIARNLLIDHLRRARHRNGPSLDAHPELVDSIVSSDDPLARTLDREVIKGWFDQLKPREREVLGLRYLADLSVNEIADCLGLSVANVQQISSRCLRRLRATAVTDVENEGARRLGALSDSE
jgi:RNA polymerase sigma-70 factor (ECF subfamily)